jgi:LmbE family N-acetylglucosaminyl deacetylase
MMKKSLYYLSTAALCLFTLLAPARAQAPSVLNAAEVALALKRLQTTGSALYVGAHPDDENTAMLAYLAQGRGARTAYLSLTRGDGGQNLIGAERGELLGLVRTHELLAARRLDGAEQFFTRAVDFGFSKSPEETLRVWGREPVLADVVWVIRRFRPDVVITRFPTTGEGGHGQHTASAILAREAFEAAGDPARFPEQLAYVRPWKPKRLVWNVFARGGERPAGADKMLAVDLGEYNPLLGRSYTEIAATSRSQHRSQGMGSAERRGPALNYLAHLAGEEATRDLFDGVDTTWRRVEGAEELSRLLAQAEREYDAAHPTRVLPTLVRAHRELTRLVTRDTAPARDPHPEVDRLLATKYGELLEVIRACAGLWVEAVAGAPSAPPGGEVRVTATVVNRSDFPLRLESVRAFGAARDVGAELKNNQPQVVELQETVPATSVIRQPYWMMEEPSDGLFKVDERALVGEPERSAPQVVFRLVAVGENERLTFLAPLQYRWVDRVRGELYRPFLVAPPVSARLDEQLLVFDDARPRRVRVQLRAEAEGGPAGEVRLRLPEGWKASPASVPFAPRARGEEVSAVFDVTPPAVASVGELSVELESGRRRFQLRGLSEIDYAHIPRQTVFPVAAARLVRLDLQRRGRRVGYVAGAGDEVPEALRQVGYEVVLLSDAELETEDLSRFDAVVTGVRAYNTRPALRAQQRRLLEYVERGGTLVVQYNTAERALEGFALGPYPLKISRGERVTVEDAPVRLLAPQDELLSAPNKIGPADFENWVQERGLEFPSEWDARYTPLFGMSDPGEAEKRGATLVARHGKGVYVYTSLAFFRQLPAGVPGAYRLFVNFISAGKK